MQTQHSMQTHRSCKQQQQLLLLLLLLTSRGSSIANPAPLVHACICHLSIWASQANHRHQLLAVRSLPHAEPVCWPSVAAPETLLIVYRHLCRAYRHSCRAAAAPGPLIARVRLV